MKKQLLVTAIAGLFAVPAVAQVAVTGTIDVSATHTNKVTARSATTAATNPNVTTQTNDKNTGGGSAAAASRNGFATSEIIFQATEDLGGGLKATARFSQAIGTNSFVERDRYVDVAGGFGSVRLGRFNPFTGGLNAYSGAATTDHGGQLNDLSTGGVKLFGTAIAGGSFERNNGLMQFTSPSFNGFTVNALYGSNANDISTTANSVTDSKFAAFGAAYTAGPLKVEFASGERKNKTAAVAGTRARAFFTNGTHNATQLQAVGAETTIGVGDVVQADSLGFVDQITAGQAFNDASAILAAGNTPGGAIGGVVTVAGVRASLALDAKHKYQWLAGSYNLGPATVMASHSRRETTSDSITSAVQATLHDVKLNSVGLMVPLGATTLRLAGYNGKDDRGTGTTDDAKLSGQQISATYSLSKRTYLYAVIGESEVKRNSADGTIAERKEKSNALGLVHTF